MATFIDDQGGTGWKPGSHLNFRLAAAWLPTANVNAFKVGIKALRKKLGRRETFEFKFTETKSRPEWRTPFYDLAMELGLRFSVCSIDKTRIREGSVSASMFHQVCAVSLAVHLRGTYLQAEEVRCVEKGGTVLLGETILVDDNEDDKMLEEIELAFRALRSGRNPKVGLTQKPMFRDSEIDDTVQLADMVMGAVGAHLDGDSTWYNYIRGGGRDLGVVNLVACRCLPGSDDLAECVCR